MSFNAWYYSYLKCIIRDRIWLPFRSTWVHAFLLRRIHVVLFIFLCFFICLSSFCVLCPTLPVSLDCPFLTSFANQVYDPRGGGSQPLASEDDLCIPLRISLTFSNLDLIF